MKDKKAIGRPRMQSRQGLYAKTQKYADKALLKVVSLLDSKNEAIALGAARTVLDKCVPNLKAFMIASKTMEPIRLSLTGEMTEK